VTADEYEKPPPEEKEQDANSRIEMSSTPAQDVYEIRHRNDRDGLNALPLSDFVRKGLTTLRDRREGSAILLVARGPTRVGQPA
jgi:hypothetical protein